MSRILRSLRDNPPPIWVRVLLLLAVALPGAGLAFLELGGGSPVVYQSSDGGWVDCDCPGLKSRGFRGVVYSFHTYRIACDAPNAKLWRVTPKRGLVDPHSWFDSFDSPRWQVPLSRGNPDKDGMRRWPVRGREASHCLFRDLSDTEIALLQETAERHLTELTASQ